MNRLSLVGILCLTARYVLAQSGAVQLRIDIEKTVNYYQDVTDYSRLAADAGPRPVAASRNFSTGVSIADIVAVNGEPVRGTAFGQGATLITRPNPTPGQGIADVFAGGIIEWIFDIQSATDRTVDEMGRPNSIGTILIRGLAGDARPSGLAVVGGGNFSIVGGTGAFVGARGQAAFTPPTAPPRSASFAEDPANRRSLDGGSFRLWLNLIPLSRPEIVTTASGPAVVHHSNNTAVTAAAPAQAGELLTLYATGLGPTTPPLNPGEVFKSSPPHVLSSAVRVLVNGAAAEVLYAGGYAGTDDAYQINFRMPSGLTSGSATLQLITAWISGKEVRIAVR
ncbi:MAG TPA: hypothetical protein VFB63_26420 [Bryobacteraceae bacterium]|nr:hypothetical protein [Bryobacteraceae bacterium]